MNSRNRLGYGVVFSLRLDIHVTNVGLLRQFIISFSRGPQAAVLCTLTESRLSAPAALDVLLLSEFGQGSNAQSNYV